MSLSSIPTELLPDIFQHHGTPDLLSIAITCKRFYAVAVPQIYHSIFVRNNTDWDGDANWAGAYCDLGLSNRPKILETYEHWSNSRLSLSLSSGLRGARQTTIVQDLKSFENTLQERTELRELVKFAAFDRWPKLHLTHEKKCKIEFERLAVSLAPTLRHLWLCSSRGVSKALSPQMCPTHLTVDCSHGSPLKLDSVFRITSLQDLVLLTTCITWFRLELRKLILPTLSSFIITSTFGPYRKQEQMLRWPASLEKIMLHMRTDNANNPVVRHDCLVYPAAIFESLSHLKTHLKEIWITTLGPTANGLANPTYSFAVHFSALRHLAIPFSFYQTVKQYYGREHHTADTNTRIWQDLPVSIERLYLQVGPKYWYDACYACNTKKKPSTYGRHLLRELDSIRTHKHSYYPCLKSAVVWNHVLCWNDIHEPKRSSQVKARDCGIQQGGRDLQQRFKDEGIDLSFWRTPDPFLHFPSWRDGRRAS